MAKIRQLLAHQLQKIHLGLEPTPLKLMVAVVVVGQELLVVLEDRAEVAAEETLER
jgi:hypothetical protein